MGITGLEDKINPQVVDVSRLAHYAGASTTLDQIRGWAVVLRRGENPWAALIPITERMFRLDGIDYFRLEIVTGADGKPIELVGHYDNALPTDLNERFHDVRDKLTFNLVVYGQRGHPFPQGSWVRTMGGQLSPQGSA